MVKNFFENSVEKVNLTPCCLQVTVTLKQGFPTCVPQKYTKVFQVVRK